MTYYTHIPRTCTDFSKAESEVGIWDLDLGSRMSEKLAIISAH